jgi:membrane protease YdiL (CAAX protease family)
MENKSKKENLECKTGHGQTPQATFPRLALLLLVPAPSLGVIFGMFVSPNSIFGRLLFVFSKIWLFAFPALWLRSVEKKKFSLSPVKKGGFATGITSGILISAFIGGLYFSIGDMFIDTEFFKTRLTSVGLGSPIIYLGGMIYWVLINSVLEEYVWRWFCVEQCAAIWRKPVAIAVSALFFTFHHILAMSVYFSPLVVFLCSSGVFIGGIIWSAMYIRYHSIWPGYISHAIVDLMIFGIGAVILFG